MLGVSLEVHVLLMFCCRDSVLVTVADGATSFYAGFAVFAFAGFIANELKEPVDNIVGSGTLRSRSRVVSLH